jgi:outer membrane lipoprotein-sorting protein
MRFFCGAIPVFLSFTFLFSMVLPVYGEEPAPEQLTAEQILQRVASTYAKCRSYQDSGLVETIFIETDREWTEKISFKTAFVRPDRFRFEYAESKCEEQNKYIIWQDGDEVLTWWDISPGIKEPPSLGMAIAGATGVSYGSANTIPALFLPKEICGYAVVDLAGAKRIDDATCEKDECFRIEGDWFGSPTTIWIDKATYLIRRIDSSHQFEDFRTSDTTTYEPEINVDIPDELLEFNPPE